MLRIVRSSSELTLGFRVPREVLDYAAKLLPSVAPDLEAPQSLRGGPGTLSVRRVRDVHDAAVTAILELQARDGSIGVVVADDRLEELAKTLEADGVDHAVLTDEGVAGERVHLVPATLAKGLEYDHVVVAEPAGIVAAEERGLARLYVVLTRAVTSLTVLHHEPLPVELG